MRVRRGIRRACGDAAYDAVKHASLSDHPDAGTIVYRFIRYAMAQNRPHDCSGCKRRGSCGGACGKFACTGKARRSVLGDLAHPAVEPLHRLARSVMNERHRMLQFLRFEHLENGVWFARCNPAASVIPLLMDWFSGRFNTQPFIIFDEAHNIAGVYEGRDWYLVQTENVDLPDRASEERLMQQAWKRFYDTVAVEARYNPELRRQFMPKRFWNHRDAGRPPRKGNLPALASARPCEAAAPSFRQRLTAGRPSSRANPEFASTVKMPTRRRPVSPSEQPR